MTYNNSNQNTIVNSVEFEYYSTKSERYSSKKVTIKDHEVVFIGDRKFISTDYIRFISIIMLIILTLLVDNTNAAMLTPNLINNFISADYVEYNAKDGLIFADGNIRILKDNNIINCNNLVLDLNQKLLFSYGNVVIQDDKNHLAISDNALLKEKFNDGIVNGLTIKFGENILLTSKNAERIDKDKIDLYQTNFTPCKILCNKAPFWQLSAGKTELNYDTKMATYKNMIFKVYNIPVMYTPYFAHVMPNSPAKSGLLVPSLEKNYLKIPIYYRMKPNVDFTFAPKFGHDVVIFELEARHKLSNGEYKIVNNYGEVPYKDRTRHSNYLTSSGSFFYKDLRYGFNINLVSDKAFLKNYYSRYDSYLQSTLYATKIKNENYISLKLNHFRDLRELEGNVKNPIFIPFQTRYAFNLSENKDTYLQLENIGFIFRQPNKTNFIRDGVRVTLTKDWVTPKGQLFQLSLSNRTDLYNIYNKNYFNYYSNNKLNTINYSLIKKDVITRNIPQMQLTWRYPLVKEFRDGILLLEPTISFVNTRKYKPKKDNKFLIIDPDFFELTEFNLFDANRYTGLDYYEFGRKISYGFLTSVLNDRDVRLNCFIGQLYNKDEVFIGQLYSINKKIIHNQRLMNVGSIELGLLNKVSLYYKFKKDKNFRPFRDEVGLDFNFSKLDFFVHLISFKNCTNIISNQLKCEDFKLKRNIVQATTGINYKFNENWSCGTDMHLDLKSKKHNLFYRSMRVTYLNECVNITLRLHEDYTSDYRRGIKKTRDYTFRVNFKVLNI